MIGRALIVFLAISFLALAAPRHHKGGVPCGLPRFAERLQLEKKGQLEEIWKGWKEGEECDGQKEKTKQFVRGLTEEERKTAFGHDNKHGGPSFLRGVSENVKKEFVELFRDHTISKEEKHRKFHDLANKLLSGKNLEEFNKFESEMEKQKLQWEKKVEALSPSAKTVYDKLQALREEKRKIFADASKEVREELDKLFGSFHPHRHAHRRFRRFPH